MAGRGQRADALKIVERELGKAKGLGVAFARPEDDGRLDEALSFVVWDITENGSGALNYNRQEGFIRNLLAQARQIISGSYARGSAEIGGKVHTFPRTMRTARGRVRSEDATVDERQVEAERMIAVARETILRWKIIGGVDWKFVRGVLARLCKEARRAWTQKAA
jgi:hypothetical protein